jgi:hypothetical protein
MPGIILFRSTQSLTPSAQSASLIPEHLLDKPPSSIWDFGSRISDLIGIENPESGLSNLDLGFKDFGLFYVP